MHTMHAMHTEYSAALDNAVSFTALLFGLLMLFTLINALVRHSGYVRPLADSTMALMSAGYGFVYAAFAGVLIYFGIEHLDKYASHFTSNRGIINLISVSIVAMFCLLYAALFHNTVSVIAGRRLKINPFSNVASYVLARALLIGGLVVAGVAGADAVAHHHF
jgi:hypothetical protein